MAETEKKDDEYDLGYQHFGPDGPELFDTKVHKNPKPAGRYLGTWDAKENIGLDPSNRDDVVMYIDPDSNFNKYLIYEKGEKRAPAEEPVVEPTDPDEDLPGTGIQNFDFFEMPTFDMMDQPNTDIELPSTSGGIFTDIFNDLRKAVDLEIFDEIKEKDKKD